jgi:alpha-mannosidase
MLPQPITPIPTRSLNRATRRKANVLRDVRTVANLEAKLSQLIAAIHPQSLPLDLAANTVRGEPIAFTDAARGEYRPFRVGERWGPPWSTTWFRVRGRVPPEWSGQHVVASFDIGFEGQTGFTCEALAWRDGNPWRGVDPNHRWLPIHSTEVDFYLEASAMPKAVVSGPAEAPSMIALRESGDPAFVFRQAELQVQDEAARRIALDFTVLYELAAALPDGRRRSSILEALERFTAGELTDLAAVLREPSTSSHLITAVGHAHIDTGWLWPMRETRRKCSRTFSTALALMDEYPDYVFACSQPAQYAWMKESYPSIYEGIRQKVAAGQWEPVGSMWVEADCNLPSGEALVRQFLHGKRFFLQEFGVDTRELWLPDVFGYPASLPQLIAESGGEYFLTQKLSWNDTNKPAHHTFMWEGIDGTAIFTHFPPADTYNGTFSATEVVRSAADFKDQAASNRSLYLYGWGDGGGGPEPDMIESARRLRNLDGAPRVGLGRAADFFRTASRESHDLTTWVGELYFELHRGTYTTQARTKLLNRRAEQALREAEVWAVAAGDAYPIELLDPAWKSLLINQFHDVLPGSSIDWVYEDAERELEAVVQVATGISGSAQARIAGTGDSPIVFNVNSHPRREVIEVDGQPALVEAVACGWTPLVGSVPAPEPITVKGNVIENGLLRIRWDSQGLLTSIWDKEAGREVLDADRAGNLLQVHDDNPKNWDAWDIDADYRRRSTDVTLLASSTVERDGPLRAAVTFVREFGRSRLEQRMVLDAGSRVLRFETEVDWHEEHKLLKVAFPVAVRSARATYEIQFGHVERSTHTNTTWDQARFEVCAHRWADLGEPGYGVGLLNDSKYGYDILGSVMRLSLLRAPTHPDPAADVGRHRFTYALMPHPGDFREAGVIAAAEDLNAPLRLVRGAMGSGRRSLIEVDARQVIVEAVKRAEDSDAVIVRLYEAWGGRCRARLTSSLPVSRAYLCDLLERERDKVEVRDGQLEVELTPFKILTLKLIA